MLINFLVRFLSLELIEIIKPRGVVGQASEPLELGTEVRIFPGLFKIFNFKNQKIFKIQLS